MNETKPGVDPHGIHITETLPPLPGSKPPPREEPPTEQPNVTEREWIETEHHGWVYAVDGEYYDTWIYREDVGWVWILEPNSDYMYSHEYGWFYNMKYMDRKIFYWYDEKFWLYIGDFYWKK